MHITALGIIIFRSHNNEHIKNLLTRVNSEKLIGTFVQSDPATGSYIISYSNEIFNVDF